MKRLLEAGKDYSVSRPIFKLIIDTESNSITVPYGTPEHEYRPKPVSGDLVSELMASYYSEQFDWFGKEFRVDVYQIAESCMHDIRDFIIGFVEINVEAKNPRQTKIYRFYRHNMPKTEEFNEVMILVWEHIKSFMLEDKTASESDLKRTKNCIALLQAIMEKYEEN